MRVLIAPDKFKGSCNAAAVASAIETGLRDVWGAKATYRSLPMADGGEGTVDAFIASGAVPRRVTVRGPLGDPTLATYARDGDAAIIEMAAASGLALLGETRAARYATTFGTGELIRDALDQGAKRIVLGIGGSATTDGGAGALAALGAVFIDGAGRPLIPHPQALSSIASVDLGAVDARLRNVPISVACDVDNPLLGPSGAAAIYGPQKGATIEDIAFLDEMLGRYADVAARATGHDLRSTPGAGAARGLGFGLATFLGARLAPGFTLIAEQRGLGAALADATLCITGEGRIDEQTLRGKVVAGVAKLAKPRGLAIIAFGGSIDVAAESALAALGVACFPIVAGPMSLGDAMKHAPDLIRAAAARFARVRPL